MKVFINFSIVKISLTTTALLILFNNSMSAEPVEVIPPENKILGTINGRFVFGQISSMRRDQYMLDTQNGRLWQMVQSSDGSIVLQSVPYQNTNGSYSVIPEKNIMQENKTGKK